MAGGASSRFFPVNKVFSDLTGSGRSMIQQALDRATAKRSGAASYGTFVDISRFLVVTGERAAPEVSRHLPELRAGNLLVEPEPRSTLPAVLWAAAHVRARDPGAVVLVLTADHHIDDVDEFRRCLGQALAAAQDSPAIVTIGIPPSTAAEEWAAYGALRPVDAPRRPGGEVHRLRDFEEKPARDRAELLVGEGGWAWNSGMFIFGLDALERALHSLEPGIHETYLRLCEAVETGDRDEAARHFRELPGKIGHPLQPGREVDASIDYAIMMPLARKSDIGVEPCVVHGDFGWVDLGSWAALRRVLPGDERGNVVFGEVTARNVRDSILVAQEGRRLEVRDLSGVLVVHAADGRVLAADAALHQQVREVARRAVRDPTRQSLFEDCRDCLADPGSGRVALLGLRGVHLSHRGDSAVLSPLRDRTAARPDGTRDDLLDALAERPLVLRPVVRGYAWGGGSLRRFLGCPPEKSAEPDAEAWLNSTLPGGGAGLVQAPLTLHELLAERPEILGPWSELLFGPGLPVFAKFLSTRFPPRVQLGFSKRVRPDLLLSWLVREQELLRALLASLRIPDRRAFRAYRRIWEEWATGASGTNWRESDASPDGSLLGPLRPHLKSEAEPFSLAEVVRGLCENRARIVDCLNALDLERESGSLVLVPAGTIHEISGMSLQAHPVDPAREALGHILEELAERGETGPGAEDRQRIDRARSLAEPRRGGPVDPKDEAWLPILREEKTTILEIQQSSDSTASLADFHTPFTWRDGHLAFRKGAPESGLGHGDLESSLRSLDFEPRPISYYIRMPVQLPTPAGSARARLSRLVDEAGRWPAFRVLAVSLEGASERPARFPLSGRSGSFRQVVVWRGEVVAEDGRGRTLRLGPGAPALVPAALSSPLSLVTREPAELVLVDLPVGSAAGETE
jgi:mannose-1-phosphate guanylyltransferase